MLLLLPMTAAQHLFMLITTVLHIIFFDIHKCQY